MVQVWNNPSLMNFFMREQAQETLTELIDRYGNQDELFDEIESTYEDIDDLEEDLYSMSVGEFAAYNDLELNHEDDIEDD